MEAAGLGVHVTVVERNDTSPQSFEPPGTRRLFSTFTNCLTRSINATEYDWPHADWQQGRFLDCSLPQASPTSAAVQAGIWRRAWRAFAVNQNGQKEKGFGMVDLIDRLDAASFRVVHGPDAELTVIGPWASGGEAEHKPRTFGALLSCVGIGSEDVRVEGSRYTGPRFWSDADGIYAGENLPDGVTQVVISGGGDGAMQDLQRVATSYYGRRLYERLESLLTSDEKPDHQLRADLLAADEIGWRSFCWAGTKDAALAVAARWHDSIERCVHAFFERQWSAETFGRIAKDLLREQLLDGRLTITWVIREPTPGASYALNRFLVRVLIELSRRAAPRRGIFVETSRKIHDIIAADGAHVCNMAELCVGKKHTVMIGPVSANGGKAKPISANLILIRHGLESVPPVLNGPAPVANQLLPFNLP
jgi:hypothetical protein